MDKRVYTILDLAEEFGKDKQLIRRKILGLKLKSINKDSRQYSNEPLEYDHSIYVELSKAFGVSNSNTGVIHNDTQTNTEKHEEDSNKDKLIEVLERELKHSKYKLENAEKEKESLMRLLDQQQQLSLKSSQKIELLEYKVKEEKREDNKKKKKWYDLFK